MRQPGKEASSEQISRTSRINNCGGLSRNLGAFIATNDDRTFFRQRDRRDLDILSDRVERFVRPLSLKARSRMGFMVVLRG